MTGLAIMVNELCTGRVFGCNCSYATLFMYDFLVLVYISLPTNKLNPTILVIYIVPITAVMPNTSPPVACSSETTQRQPRDGLYLMIRWI